MPVIASTPNWVLLGTAQDFSGTICQLAVLNCTRITRQRKSSINLFVYLRLSLCSVSRSQDLMHFSGTIVQGDGQLSVTFDELLKAMVV